MSISDGKFDALMEAWGFADRALALESAQIQASILEPKLVNIPVNIDPQFIRGQPISESGPEGKNRSPKLSYSNA